MQGTLALRGYWQMSGTGVSGLVQLAAHCEVEQGMLALQIGRSASDANDWLRGDCRGIPALHT